ncbi:hypothetical protein HDU80_011507 [Chytriomyces hyalinus]|nr:hypothetical protein HDU80_011507 [Chytriomyces hyalinus]
MPIPVRLSTQTGRRQPPSIARLLVDAFKHSKVPATHDATPTANIKHTLNFGPEQGADQAALDRVAENPGSICSVPRVLGTDPCHKLLNFCNTWLDSQPPSIASLLVDPFRHPKVPATRPTTNINHTLNLAALSFHRCWKFIRVQADKFLQYLAGFVLLQSSTPQAIPGTQGASVLSAPPNIAFAFHGRSLHSKNHFRCVNLLKLESMEATLLHLQAELDEERKGRVFIANVHTKMQSIAVQQKETIERLEGIVESLQNDVKTATSRLLAFQSGNSSLAGITRNSRTLINLSQNYGSDIDYKDYKPPIQRTRCLFKNSAARQDDSETDTTDIDSCDEDEDFDSDSD